MRRAVSAAAIFMLLCLVFLISAHTGLAAPRPAGSGQIIVVSPDDISTPTPTALFSLVPAPTPQPSAEPTAAPIATNVSVTVTSQEQLPGMGADSTYKVKPGDTLLSVALETGVDVSEMYCVVVPDFHQGQPLVIGDVLRVPAPGFRCHEVAPGETLASIGAKFGVDPQLIYAVAWNHLRTVPMDAVRLVPGTHLRIPPAESDPSRGSGFLSYMLNQPVGVSPFVGYAVGGPSPAVTSVPVPANWPYGTGHFVWPVHGWLSQGYRNDHRAIDIAAPIGTLVTAADRGVVLRAGWNNQGYGLFVIIDHNIDYLTLYAHLSEILVKEGQVVGQGQLIGKVGSTGNSTGPHLHFEIRDFGRRVNPLSLLAR